jgi:RNA-dependent RNA polymerase
LVPFKPDWKKAEVEGPRDVDYYISDRALGVLYRGITLLNPNDTTPSVKVASSQDPGANSIYIKLLPIILRTLYDHDHDSDSEDEDEDNGNAAAQPGSGPAPQALFNRYMRELRFIRLAHTLVDSPETQLAEEEIVVGTILANCTEKRWRNDCMFRMKQHADMLVKDIQARMVKDIVDADYDTLRAGLKTAWEAWVWSLGIDQHGKDSFGLVALGTVLDCLKRLNSKSTT